jgi:hypothetical protein
MTGETVMTPRLWDFGITPDQGLKIATIMANWAMIDNEIGHLLQRTSGIKGAKDGAELVHAITFTQKIRILDQRRKQGRLPETLNDLIREMVWITNNYWPSRNMLAHSILSGNPARSIGWSQAKLKAIDLGDLDGILSESRYATWVSHNLFLTHLGASPDALPPRPPERPAPPWLAEIHWADA